MQLTDLIDTMLLEIVGQIDDTWTFRSLMLTCPRLYRLCMGVLTELNYRQKCIKCRWPCLKVIAIRPLFSDIEFPVCSHRCYEKVDAVFRNDVYYHITQGSTAKFMEKHMTTSPDDVFFKLRENYISQFVKRWGRFTPT